MQNAVHSSLSPRRGFLKTFTWLSGAVALMFGGGKAFAEEEHTCACHADVTKLKKEVVDKQFEGLRDKARYIRRLREKLGPRVLDETSKLTYENLENWMKNADIPKEQRNLTQVKKLFGTSGDVATFTWVEDTPERLKVKVTHCRWAEELKKDGNDGELGYALACAGDPGYCAGLNPAMKFARTKTLMMGDDHCDHTYELKS